jgi:hypothetical protein
VTANPPAPSSLTVIMGWVARPSDIRSGETTASVT